jgi:hypothetical protein
MEKLISPPISLPPLLMSAKAPRADLAASARPLWKTAVLAWRSTDNVQTGPAIIVTPFLISEEPPCTPRAERPLLDVRFPCVADEARRRLRRPHMARRTTGANLLRKVG